MRVLMLYTPGREVPKTLPRLKKMGYEVELVDTRVSLLCLTNELDIKVSSHSQFLSSSIVHPLRAAWVNMLRRFADADKYTLFCESDAYPHISADRMKEWIDQAPEDACVVRLIRYSNRDLYRDNIANDITADELPIEYVPVPPFLDSEEVWGTHALWVPPGKREQLADLFAGCALPVDVAIGWAVWSEHPCKGYSTNGALFSQDTYGDKSNKDTTPLLVCMWIDERCSDVESRVKDIFNMLPMEAHLVLTTNKEDLQHILTQLCSAFAATDNWEVQLKDTVWTPSTKLSELKPEHVDVTEFPVTCVLSQFAQYPALYLRDVAFRYKTLNYDHASFGMVDRSTGKKVCTGTLVIKTSQLEDVTYKTAQDLKEELLHYDMSSWTPKYTLKKVEAPLSCIKGITPGVTMVVNGKECRRYDDMLVFLTGEVAYIEAEDDNSIKLNWEESK